MNLAKGESGFFLQEDMENGMCAITEVITSSTEMIRGVATFSFPTNPFGY